MLGKYQNLINKELKVTL